MRVLVAEDDVSVRGAVQKVLEAEGYDVVLVADGLEAVEVLGRGAVDLLLLDLGLPVLSGWDALDRIAAQNPALPVILMTGQPGHQDRAATAGVCALMEKPLDPPRLLETMRQILAEPEALRHRCDSGRSVRHVWSRSRPFLQNLRKQPNPPLRHSRLHRASDSSGL